MTSDTIRGPFGQPISRETHLFLQRQRLRGKLRKAGATIKALRKELGSLRAMAPDVPQPAGDGGGGRFKEAVGRPSVEYDDESSVGGTRGSDGEGSPLVRAARAKIAEASEALVSAKIGSRTEKVLRETIGQYQRMIEVATRESRQKKVVTPAPASPTKFSETVHSSKRRNEFSPLF